MSDLAREIVDGQGNFGSVDGDSAAAMRYTEIRMSKIAHELMADLEKETVDFVDNYDGTEKIPDVMPTKIPNLLVNGSSGIAVGMATNIPPHNLTEVINGCLAYVENEDISIEGLMEHIPGPDFPTAAIINGRRGIEEAYRTGRGKVYIRARAEVEADAKTGRETIIVHEIPYQVNKARLIEKIAELVKDKRVEGISALRDESDKDGMRIVIEVKRDAVGEVVLNNLYSQTQLQVSFGINMVALHHGQPKIMNLKEIIAAFVRHRREVVTRRTIFELRKARDRAHILEALAIALANIDPIIELIRRAPTPAEAKAGLIARSWDLGNVSAMLERAGDDAARPEWLEPEFGVRDGQYYLTEQQAQAILDLRLQKLTGLEHEKLLDEYKELRQICGAYQRRRLYRPSAGGQHPRHDPLLLQPRSSLLDESVSAAGSQPRRARSSDRQPAAAGSQRAHHRDPAGPRIRRGRERLYGHRQRYREENGADRIQPSAFRRYYRG